MYVHKNFILPRLVISFSEKHIKDRRFFFNIQLRLSKKYFNNKIGERRQKIFFSPRIQKRNVNEVKKLRLRDRLSKFLRRIEKVLF